MKKALSPAMWLIIAIVVALVVALVVITIVNKTANNAGNRGNSIIDIFGDTLQKQSCESACTKCRELGGGGCNDEKINKDCSCK